MMNLDHVPPIPAMNTAAVQFLDLLADPKAARKLMNDLVAAHAKAAAAHAEATKLRGEVVEKQSKFDQERAAFEQNRAAHSAFLTKTGGELDARHAAADERELRLREAGAAHDERESSIAAREVALKAREDVIAAQERVQIAAKAAYTVDAHRISRALEHFRQADAILRE